MARFTPPKQATSHTNLMTKPARYSAARGTVLDTEQSYSVPSVMPVFFRPPASQRHDQDGAAEPRYNYKPRLLGYELVHLSLCKSGAILEVHYYWPAPITLGQRHAHTPRCLCVVLYVYIGRADPSGQVLYKGVVPRHHLGNPHCILCLPLVGAATHGQSVSHSLLLLLVPRQLLFFPPAPVTTVSCLSLSLSVCVCATALANNYCTLPAHG
jgi:hypothetical protein